MESEGQKKPEFFVNHDSKLIINQSLELGHNMQVWNTRQNLTNDQGSSDIEPASRDSSMLKNSECKSNALSVMEDKITSPAEELAAKLLTGNTHFCNSDTVIKRVKLSEKSEAEAISSTCHLTESFVTSPSFDSSVSAELVQNPDNCIERCDVVENSAKNTENNTENIETAKGMMEITDYCTSSCDNMVADQGAIAKENTKLDIPQMTEHGTHMKSHTAGDADDISKFRSCTEVAGNDPEELVSQDCVDIRCLQGVSHKTTYSLCNVLSKSDIVRNSDVGGQSSVPSKESLHVPTDCTEIKESISDEKPDNETGPTIGLHLEKHIPDIGKRIAYEKSCDEERKLISTEVESDELKQNLINEEDPHVVHTGSNNISSSHQVDLLTHDNSSHSHSFSNPSSNSLHNDRSNNLVNKTDVPFHISSITTPPFVSKESDSELDDNAVGNFSRIASEYQNYDDQSINSKPGTTETRYKYITCQNPITPALPISRTEGFLSGSSLLSSRSETVAQANFSLPLSPEVESPMDLSPVKRQIQVTATDLSSNFNSSDTCIATAVKNISNLYKSSENLDNKIMPNSGDLNCKTTLETFIEEKRELVKMSDDAASVSGSMVSDVTGISLLANIDESSNVPSSIGESSNPDDTTSKLDDDVSNCDENGFSNVPSMIDLSVMDDTSNLVSETGSVIDTNALSFTVPQNINEDTMMSVDDVTKESRPKKKSKSRRSSTCSMAVELGLDSDKIGHNLPVEKIFEYQWPQEKNGEWFLLQEQLSEYLGIKSFKRKYPDMTRHNVEMSERNFLKEKSVVTETQCDLGLTAIRTEDVLEMMSKEYADKYKELIAVLHEKEKKRADDNKSKYQQPTIDKSKMKEFIKKAVKRCAEYNQNFMREKREERTAYCDLQTMEIHYPKKKKTMVHPCPMGSYPVALLPGQYQDYYKRYTSEEMKYFPVNTVLFDSPKKLKTIYADPNEPTDSESEESSQSREGSDTIASQNDSEAKSEIVASLQSQKEPINIEPAIHERVNDSPVSQDETTEGKEQVAVKLPECRICKEGTEKDTEQFIVCSECKRVGHPSCLDLTDDMLPIILNYPWQCMECKTCVECMEPHDEDKMMFCDICDRGYHTFCVGLRSLPNGNWKCASCKPVEKVPKLKKPRKEKESKQEAKDGVVKIRKKPGPKPKKDKLKKELQEPKEPRKRKEKVARETKEPKTKRLKKSEKEPAS